MSEFDSLFFAVAQKHEGIEGLLTTFFSFLRRKTDFFTAVDASQAESLVLKVMREQSKLVRTPAPKKAVPQPQVKIEEERTGPKIFELPDPEDSKPTTEPEPAVLDASEKHEAEPVIEAEKPEEEKPEKEGLQVPVNNGGKTSKYVWSQSLRECTVVLEVPLWVKPKDVSCVIKPDFMNLKINKLPQLTIERGLLCKKVIPDDSMWTLETAGSVRHLTINLQKVNTMEWWDCLIQGDERIDTQKINPENSQLSDLDSETRGTVEKMMFDQRQQALGLPKSDEIKKIEMLEKFKKQHPEMDFSHAKFT